MAKKPTCICGRLKVDGRCTASPSCDDFRKPSARAMKDDAEARIATKRAEVESARMLRAKEVTRAARRVDPERIIYRRDMSAIVTKAKRSAG